MKLKQKILTLVLSLCMVAACLPVVASAETAPQGLWTDYAAAAFAGGSGTKADPYQIATAEQLALLATDGMLVKRPILAGKDFVLVGFRQAEWEETLK